jgi:hypothetical protein
MVDPERPRTWQEARERTLETWGELRGSIVDPDEVELLIGIHAACGLCQLSSDEKAAAIAEGRAEEGAIKCDFCPFYDQFGGCRTLNRETGGSSSGWSIGSWTRPDASRCPPAGRTAGRPHWGGDPGEMVAVGMMRA